MRLPGFLVRTHSIIKPGVGRIHMTAARWAPNTIRAMYFQPEGTQALHEIPDSKWEAVLAAESDLELMALLRREEPDADT